MPFICGYMGKLTKDPVIKQTPKGKKICNFSIANDEGWGDAKRTDFIQCVAFEKTANTISVYFSKGDNIIVEGTWRNNPWQKNEKGYDIPNWQFLVSKVHFLPKYKAKVDEDDEYEPYSDSGVQMAGVSMSDDNMDFAPISGETEDLPF